jgi:hypothetical protein
MEPVATMSDNVGAFAALSNDELVEQVRDLAAGERRASVALIRSLVEFDTRRLYLREGCSSLFTYCTHVLHLSEDRHTTGSKRHGGAAPRERARGSRAR